MPVIVDEVVISVEVGNREAGGVAAPAEATMPVADRQALVALDWTAGNFEGVSREETKPHILKARVQLGRLAVRPNQRDAGPPGLPRIPAQFNLQFHGVDPLGQSTLDSGVNICGSGNAQGAGARLPQG